VVADMVRQSSEEKPSWIRYSGVGLDFVAALVGFALVGYWVDHHYHCRPWGLVIGALLGLVGGSYNLIRASLAAFRRLEQEEHPDKQQDRPP
jgi:F0F1-type ATP synthase assembly protein I